MATNTLSPRATGETILDTFFNDFNTALNSDFVGRNSSGVPTASQNLGTVAIPWGTVRANSIVANGTTIDPELIAVPQNSIISGKKRSTSNQPAFITPNGGALTAIIAMTATDLVFDVNGTTVTGVADVTLSGLTAAPGSNNTALVNNVAAADQSDTRMWGEEFHRRGITIGTIGTEITSLNGKWAAFKVNNGGSNEYFMAFVDTTNNQLIKARRGYFYDSALAPINRIVFSNTDVITLMKLGWVFLQSNGTTAEVSYTNPVWSINSPSGPATGDYWYDLANNTWKRYDGASFQIINRTLIGLVIMDSTNCVAARSYDFYKNHRPENNIRLEVQTTEIVRAAHSNVKVFVNGNLIQYGQYLPTWNITTDLAGSTDMYDAAEQASRHYFMYLKDTGDEVISDIEPYYRADLNGLWYHPHNPWRAVGIAFNNTGSNITNGGGIQQGVPNGGIASLHTGNGWGSTNTKFRRYTTEILIDAKGLILTSVSASLGGSLTIMRPGLYQAQCTDGEGTGDVTFGITKNDSAGTTNFASTVLTDDLLATSTSGSTVSGQSNCLTGVPFFANIGDVITMHGNADGGMATTDTGSYLRLSCIELF